MAESHPPFAIWNDADHSGAVIIVTTVCLLYWLIPGILQQILSLVNNIRFTWADGFFTVTMITGVVQSSLLLAAAHHGFGKAARVIQPGDIILARQYYYASSILYVVTLGLIKCSAALFIANLTVKNRGSLRHIPKAQKWQVAGVLVLTGLWTIAATIVVALPCRGSDICIGTMDRWRGVFAGDAVTDIAIAAFAANIIWRTNASFSIRLVWYIPFVLRICVPFFSGFRLLTISDADLATDPTIKLWLFTIMGQIQILFSLIGSATPALKKTMNDLVSNYGAVGDSQANTRATGSNTKHNVKNSFPLKYLQASSKGNDSSGRHKGSSFVPFVGSGVSGNARVSRSNTYREHTRDDDSQEGIIRQDEYVVSYGNAEDGRRGS